MTREEQLDALIREALKHADDLPDDMELRHRERGHYDSTPLYAFARWLRVEFLKTQAP